MTGIVSWEQLIFIIAAIAGAVMLTVSALWALLSFTIQGKRQIEEEIAKIVSERKDDVKRLYDIMEKNDAETERRIGALEIFHAGLVSVLKQMEEFREEVRADFIMLREERKTDMQRLHVRLDQLVLTRTGWIADVDRGE